MHPGKRCVLAVVLILGFLGAACNNAFDGFADKGSKEAKLEEARTAQDHGDFQTAVALLETLHAESPGDAEITRSLASALSGRAGLNFFDLVARAQDAPDAPGDTTIRQLVAAVPHPVTDNHLSDVSRAIVLEGAIASSSGDANDYFSLALYYSAQAVLVILKDTDRAPVDGVPDTFTAVALSDADAQLVYGSLDNALTNFGAGKAGLDLESEVLKSLNDLKSEIDAKAGTTIGDKLRAYLSSVYN
ncbi:MAG: hypothetical protein ACXWW2_09755 [Candidatus Deferrimicrobiaceae bacterium]